MILKSRIKVALSSYKENLVSQEEAAEIIITAFQAHCEDCSHQKLSSDLVATLTTIERAIDDLEKEDLQCPYAPNVTGVECTE